MFAALRGEDVAVLGGVGVRQLLKKRYFGRLWIVQELILAVRVVVRIGYVNYHHSGW